jgi:phage tail protein X
MTGRDDLHFNLTPPRRSLFSAHEKDFALAFYFRFHAFSLARAQDDATQQQIDQINGQIQDLLDAQAAQGKRIDALEKEISDLQDKLNQPAANDSASADDLKKLAGQVQDLAKKQQDDNDLILKELKSSAKAGISTTSHKPRQAFQPTIQPQPPAARKKVILHDSSEKDTLSAIAKAYSAELKVKVTTSQILAANPGLNPNNLIVGKKIFIPEPQ